MATLVKFSQDIRVNGFIWKKDEFHLVPSAVVDQFSGLVVERLTEGEDLPVIIPDPPPTDPDEAVKPKHVVKPHKK